MSRFPVSVKGVVSAGGGSHCSRTSATNGSCPAASWSWGRAPRVASAGRRKTSSAWTSRSGRSSTPGSTRHLLVRASLFSCTAASRKAPTGPRASTSTRRCGPSTPRIWTGQTFRMGTGDLPWSGPGIQPCLSARRAEVFGDLPLVQAGPTSTIPTGGFVGRPPGIRSPCLPRRPALARLRDAGRAGDEPVGDRAGGEGVDRLVQQVDYLLVGGPCPRRGADAGGVFQGLVV